MVIQSYFAKIHLRRQSMMVVRIEKPTNMTLAMYFTELRSWFDENNCQPIRFSRSGREVDKLVFDATFSGDTQARIFASAFGKYRPSMRRTTSFEQADLRKSLERA
jgi:hypothetical protein